MRASRRRMRIVGAATASVLACVALAPRAGAQAGATLSSRGLSATAPRKAITDHEITIGGRRIEYTATVADDIIDGADGKPGAAVVTIAYTRDGVADEAQRPVAFLFNGGPGASSSPLHMSALGPVRRVAAAAADRSSATFGENRASPIDAFDLVFIDPVSTGFSRALPGVNPKQWYDGKRDALEVGQVISDWLRAHHRSESPRFLVGESYGTTRVGLILEYCRKLRFDGVVLVSGGGRVDSGPNAVYVASVPSMAAGAYFHDKVDRRGRTVQQFVDQARHFARTRYAAALGRGNSLPAAERHRMAKALSAYIGLPASLIEAHDLRISLNTYMFNLLKDRGLRTGLLDVRATSALVANAAGAIDDPALGVVKPQAHTTAKPTAAAVGAVASPAVGEYLREALKFPSDDPYIGVNFSANVAWTYDKSGDTASLIAARMRDDPHMRLLAVSGFYDLAGGDDPSGFVHAGVPRARLTFLQFAAGHEVYSDEANRTRFAAALRKFVLR
jgi:carboxypeptidase C (cathepsin A)